MNSEDDELEVLAVWYLTVAKSRFGRIKLYAFAAFVIAVLVVLVIFGIVAGILSILWYWLVDVDYEAIAEEESL